MAYSWVEPLRSSWNCRARHLPPLRDLTRIPRGLAILIGIRDTVLTAHPEGSELLLSRVHGVDVGGAEDTCAAMGLGLAVHGCQLNIELTGFGEGVGVGCGTPNTEEVFMHPELFRCECGCGKAGEYCRALVLRLTSCQYWAYRAATIFQNLHILSSATQASK